MDRGVYDPALLETEYLATVAPHALAQKITDGYLRGLLEEVGSFRTKRALARYSCWRKATKIYSPRVSSMPVLSLSA